MWTVTYTYTGDQNNAPAADTYAEQVTVTPGPTSMTTRSVPSIAALRHR
jgi:hypothetical protein